MAKKQTEKKNEPMIEEKKTGECNDSKCPFHGSISLRGRTFQGEVIKKFQKRVCIGFERTIYIPKFERYSKSKTKLHARLPDCLADKINIGDYIEIKECRKLSKIINFIVTKKIR
jgi:small subunit ribosomal protein S17